MSCDPALEAQLVASWDMIIRFYERDFLGDPAWQWLTPLRDLILQLREAGYDRSLRAGQSMTSFVVSRSRTHGLRDDQPSIVFEASPNGLAIRSGLGRDRLLELPYADEPEPRLLALLDELAAQPIT
jgi:hypothetical protein